MIEHYLKKTTAPQQVKIILVYIWMLKLCKFQL